jgi:pre-mRNA-splicing factor SYF1
VDLEESLGTVESTKNVYDKILELKIANAQIIVNYAAFLEENKYFEDSFKVRHHFFLRKLTNYGVLSGV